MASRPSGLRQPSSVKSSNSNIAVASGGGSVVGAAEPPAATPANKGGPMSRLPSSSSIRRKITTPAGINAPGSRDSGLATDIDHFVIGDVVYVNGDPTKRGKICFIGEVAFAKGDFAGVVLDLPIGNHDGVVQGKRYFQCAPMHGLFTKISRLARDPLSESPSTPRASQSMASSVVMTPDPQISSGASATERTPSPSGRRDSQSKFGLTPAMMNMNSSLVLGERVIVASATGGTKIGILRYLGTTEFAAGDWAGVELLTPMGKNNGAVGGKSYFNCKEKHGLFVPASKVISSPVNKTPRRHGSRESLISVSSMASSAASRSIRRPMMRESQCLPSCSLQSVLAEKEKHVERLIKERELDRVDLANLSRQFEDKIMELKRAQVESSGYQQQLSTAAGDSEAVERLQNTVEEERRKLEDLQYTLDEEKIMKADLQAQLDSLLAKSSDDSKKTDSYQAEKEEHSKEMDELRSKLDKQISESKEASARLVQAQTELLTMQKTIDEIRQSSSSKESEAAHKMELSQILTTAHQNEITALRDAATTQSQVVDKLNQQLSDKKRREEELKEKVQKLELEYETTLKQKCSLEAEVIDLVNSKTGTSELLTGKIKDMSQEVQDLREKLQSTEEDKAVLRRINAEFKSRLAKHEESEAALKKSVEEISAKLSEEKENIEKTMTSQVATLESEKQSLDSLNKKLNEDISLLNSKISEAEKSMQNASSSSKEQLEELEKLKAEGAEGLKKLAEAQQLLEKVKEEKSKIEEEAQNKEKQLTNDNSKLAEEVQKLTGQLSSTTDEVAKLKKEVETLKTELSQSKASHDEKVAAIKSLEEDNADLKTQLDDSGCMSADLQVKLQALKKDKSALKEQLASYKADSSRFEEIESGLSQELLSLRSKLEQKTKAMSELEKELAEKKADIESSKASTLDASSPQAHIDFLNSIIVDLQKKNEELIIKLNVLINGGGGDADANSNSVAGGATTSARPYQSLRPYCDICEKFDLHDTEDCPAQVSEENTHYGSLRGESRPYCNTCEIFGHATGECDDQETY